MATDRANITTIVKYLDPYSLSFQIYIWGDLEPFQGTPVNNKGACRSMTLFWEFVMNKSLPLFKLQMLGKWRDSDVTVTWHTDSHLITASSSAGSSCSQPSSHIWQSHNVTTAGIRQFMPVEIESSDVNNATQRACNRSVINSPSWLKNWIYHKRKLQPDHLLRLVKCSCSRSRRQSHNSFF